MNILTKTSEITNVWNVLQSHIHNYIIINALVTSANSNTYFFWNATSGSASRSDMSTPFPFALTSGCLRTSSQPTWEKKKPRFALWGSASVSLNLWCTLWSRAHSYMWFWKKKSCFRLYFSKLLIHTLYVLFAIK